MIFSEGMMKKMFRVDHSQVAAEQVAGNEDLVREILLRSHAMSLIKCRAVSKQWLSLISDPRFAQEHAHQGNRDFDAPAGIYFYNCLTKSQEIESISLDCGASQLYGVRVPSLHFLDVASEGAKIKIVQSCNGLLMCTFTYHSSGPEVRKYCVCNPTTRKYKVIPQPYLLAQESIMDFSLVFDPTESPHYKVVCVKRFGVFILHATHEIVIYSSESESWRNTSCRFHPPWSTRFRNGIFWNGVIHWISDDSIRCHTVQFDVSDENLRIWQLPPKPQSYCNYKLRYFGESRGHLHVVYIRSLSAIRFNVHEKDRITLKWSVKYRVHMSRLISTFPEIVRKPNDVERSLTENPDKMYLFIILSVLKGEKEEDSALVLAIPGKVISYNFKNKTTKMICELPSKVVDVSCLNYITAFHFIGTLYPL